jgi:uncharacterized protein
MATRRHRSRRGSIVPPPNLDRPPLHPRLSHAQRQQLLWQGVELFNAGRYFEAHESWEEIWRSQSPEPRHLFQGLVQVAAGLHIWRSRGTSAPAARVLGRGMRKLEAFLPSAMGIDVAGLLESLEPWHRSLSQGGDPPGSRPLIAADPEHR